MTMIGRSGRLLRRRSSSAIPLMPGMRTSVIRTSGTASPSASSRCSARSKLRVSISACLSAFSSTQRTDWSSSTIQTVNGRLAMCASLFERNAHKEHRLAGPAFEFDESTVTTDQLLGGRQAKAGSLRATGHQRVEHRVLQFGWYTGAVIFDFYRCYDSMTHVADSEVGHRAAAQRNRPLSVERSRRVSNK